MRNEDDLYKAAKESLPGMHVPTLPGHPMLNDAIKKTVLKAFLRGVEYADTHPVTRTNVSSFWDKIEEMFEKDVTN